MKVTKDCVTFYSWFMLVYVLEVVIFLMIRLVEYVPQVKGTCMNKGIKNMNKTYIMGT